MKRLIFLIIVLLFISKSSVSQNIEIKDNIAYIDGTRYVKLEKIKKNKYFIRDIDDNKKLLRIELINAFNRIDQRTHKLPRVYSYRGKRKSKYEVDIQTDYELIKFIYSKKLVPLTKD